MLTKIIATLLIVAPLVIAFIGSRRRKNEVVRERAQKPDGKDDFLNPLSMDPYHMAVSPVNVFRDDDDD